MALRGNPEDIVRSFLKDALASKPHEPVSVYEMEWQTRLGEGAVRAALASLKAKGDACEVFEIGWRLIDRPPKH